MYVCDQQYHRRKTYSRLHRYKFDKSFDNHLFTIFRTKLMKHLLLYSHPLYKCNLKEKMS